MPDTTLIAATALLPDTCEARMASLGKVRRQAQGDPKQIEEWAALTAEADALVVNAADRLDAERIKALGPRLKVIATFSVGYEHIDLTAAAARGITVTNTPGVLTEATADIAMLLILGGSRRASEGMAELRTKSWTGWTPTHLMGRQIGGKTLGILGLGRIGLATATRAEAFGMRVIYTGRRPSTETAAAGFEYVEDLETFLGRTDVLSIHCPLTAETHHLLSKDRIAQLPKGAIVINTARGPIIDDAALIDAAKSGHIYAVGLDVFDGEPAINPGYLELPNAFLLPHLGSATLETRTAMGNLVLDNVEVVLAGKPALTPVSA